MSLLEAIISDSQKASSRELAARMRKEQKDEKRFGIGKSLFKTAVGFLPGGKAYQIGIDLLADPIARNLGLGAQADDIKISRKNIAFGGEKAAREARMGVEDYLDEAKERNITDALTNVFSMVLDDTEYNDLQPLMSYQEGGQVNRVNKLYMDDASEFGLQEFLRTPMLANLINSARSGNQKALMDIVTIVKQSRPEIAASNQELMESIKKGLPKIDIYGEGYEQVLSQTDSALTGLTQRAQAQRANVASQAAQSGIRTGSGGFRGADAISEGLYRGTEDVYSKMQQGIQDEFDKSFVDFERLITSV